MSRHLKGEVFDYFQNRCTFSHTTGSHAKLTKKRSRNSLPKLTFLFNFFVCNTILLSILIKQQKYRNQNPVIIHGFPRVAQSLRLLKSLVMAIHGYKCRYSQIKFTLTVKSYLLTTGSSHKVDGILFLFHPFNIFS